MVIVLCENPYVNAHLGQAYPCGDCLPCRFNRRRIWAHRIMLEATLYESNCFATLTYEDAKLRRTSSGMATLAPWDLQSWLKRFRKALVDRSQSLSGLIGSQKQDEIVQRVRFYAVGEYGDATWRPHYHVAIFNFETCARGRTLRRPGSEEPKWRDCCDSCRMVGKTWGHGNVDLGILEASSAQYVAGYVTKKLTRSDDPILAGRHPEFARMSNRPGIGADITHEIASAFLKHDLDATQTDVPVSLRHGSRELPLGRYLRRRIRKQIGREETIPQIEYQKLQAEMLPVRKAALDASVTLKRQILDNSKQKRRNFKARSAIYNKGKKGL